MVGSLRGVRRAFVGRGKFRLFGEAGERRPTGGRAAAGYSLEMSQPRTFPGLDAVPVWMATAKAVRVPSGAVETATTHHCRYGGSAARSTPEPGWTLVTAAVADRSTTMKGQSVVAGHCSTVTDPVPVCSGTP